MAYQIELIKKSDGAQIIKLFKNVFNQPMCERDSYSIFIWFYFENILKKNYSRGVYQENLLLSYWGFIPIYYIKNGVKYKGSLSLQLVSQKAILGTTLALWKKIKKDLIKNDVNVCFTINHENSAEIFRSLKWEVTTTPVLLNISHIFILINDLIIKRMKNKKFIFYFSKLFIYFDFLISAFISFFSVNSNHVRKVDAFNNRSDNVIQIMNRSINYGIYLDLEYLNWRYVEKPNNKYTILSYIINQRIKGFLVYSVKEQHNTKIGYIMDIIANPNDDYIVKELITCAKKKLYQDKVSVISALSFKKNIFYSSYRNSFFIKIPQIFLPHKSFFSLYTITDKIKKLNIEDWHISWGLHDNV